MAGAYPDVPSHRLAYDVDGSIGVDIDDANNVYELSSGALIAANDESASVIVNSGNGYGRRFCILFPELRDIFGVFTQWQHRGNDTGHYADLQKSSNTSNGIDGTWTSVSHTAVQAGGGLAVQYRENIDTVSMLGVNAVRWHMSAGYGSSGQGSNLLGCHLYGVKTAGENPNRLDLWMPTTNDFITGSYLDWGNAARSSSQDITFRVKNRSATLTANSITISIDALTDTTPSFAGMHSFSYGGGSFGATASIGSLAPGAISGVVTMRRTMPSDAVLSIWAARVTAAASSWT